MTTNNTKLPFVLYHKQACPFCYLVRHAIDELGLNIEQRDIVENNKFREQLVQGGGKQQVPCLHITDPEGGIEWLYESRDIIEYLTYYHNKQQEAA